VMSPLVGFQLPLRTMEIRRAGKFVAWPHSSAVMQYSGYV
jgi:hypothetical protein